MTQTVVRNAFLGLFLLMSFSQKLLAANAPAENRLSFAALQSEGLIGVTENSPLDNPADNIFHVNVDRPLAENTAAWLVYELEGVADHGSVSRSINDQLALGGYLVKTARGWREQRERIALSTLKPGDNVIRFSLPAGARHAYRIKNLRIELQEEAEACRSEEPLLVVSRQERLTHLGEQVYVKGFVAGPGYEKAQVNIAGQAARIYRGEFEALVQLPASAHASNRLEMDALFPNGEMVCQQLELTDYQQADYVYELESGLYQTAKEFTPEAGNAMRLGGASLVAGQKAMKQAARLSITSLRAVDIPALDAGMVNVTRYHEGYRFLPHGTVFSEEVNLRLAYEESKIPEGYTAEDIRTYYFDEQAHHWVPLQKDTVLEMTQEVLSKTTHFTDMINAIIKVPESPEVQAYTSTSMKGIKAANPTAGINLINPPSANNTGSASLAYPLNLPAGRNGMQPQLAISYNSGGGNGWLGLGWSLQIPAITVDTRWGVPRFDKNQETETYLLNGEMLTPTAHRGDLEERTGSSKQFYPRVEGAFNKIERKGSDPTSYYWVVTDKSGTKYFYGGNGSLSTDQVLMNEQGISYWPLLEMRDIHGNGVKYTYEHKQGNGEELYISEINYTQYKGSSGKYAVKFYHYPTPRPDVIINGRYGLKQVTDELLGKVEITYNGSTVRSYGLTYELGNKNTLYKTLLTEIAEYDSENKLFNKHTFDYYNEVAPEGNFNPLETGKNWTVGGPSLSGELISDVVGFEDEATVLSGSKSTDFSASVSVTVGPGSDVTTKALSAGGNVGFGKSSSEGISTMVDLNSDGLPDKVYWLGSTLYYCQNVGNTNGAGEFKDPIPVIDGRQFQRDKTTSFNGGIEAHVGAGSASAMFGVSGSTSKTKTTAYFTDVNGDQLIDIVDDGTVYFSYLDADGTPAFTTNSGLTPSAVFADGSLDTSLFPSQEEELALAREKNPLHDMVRLWIAPFDGQISIAGDITLQQPKGEFIDEKADGIAANIQIGEQEPQWSVTIEAGDYSSKPANLSNLTVNKGDHVYFRLQSRDNGSHDEVSWSPIITYQNKDLEATDANGKALYRFVLAEDFILSAPQEIGMPYNGKVTIESRFIKAITSDTVILEVSRKRENEERPRVIKTFTYSWADEISGDSLNWTIDDIAKQDELSFRIRSTSNLAWSDIRWEPFLYYHQIDDKAGDKPINAFNDKNEPVVQVKPVVDYQVYNAIYDWAEPYIMPDSGQVTLKGTIDAKGPGIVDFPAIDAYITVKTRDSLLSVDTIRVSANMGELQWQTSVAADSAAPIWVELFIPTDASTFANAFIPNLIVKALTDSTEARVSVGRALKIAQEDMIFGPLYRSWGHFSYNGNGERANRRIYRHELKLDKDDLKKQKDVDLSGMTKEEMEEQDVYDPAKEDFIVLVPDGVAGKWMGYDNYTLLDATYMQSSRFGADDISPVDFTSGSGARAVNKVSRSTSESVFAGLSGPIGGGSFSISDGTSTILTDYMDLNGDRYPDLVTETGVQYTHARGGYSNKTLDLNKNELTESTSHTEGVSASVTPVKSELKPSRKIMKVVEVGGGRNSAGLNGSYASGTNASSVSYQDINGDGLADRLHADGRVQFNLGYSFTNPENWDFGAIQEGESTTKSAGLGFSIVGGSISAGIGLSGSNTRSTKILQDVNSDGLLDYCYLTGGVSPSLMVKMNTGYGFAEPIAWADLAILNENSSISESANAGFTFGFPFLFFRITVNPSASIGQGITRENAGFRDVDGDGHTDFVISNNSNHLAVKRSTIGKTNLLKGVQRPLGASFTLAYERVGNTYEMPNSQYVLTEVEVADGVDEDESPNLKTSFAYQDGFYNRHERDFYGFAEVVTTTFNGTKEYTRVIQKFDNRSFYQKGLLLSERMEDAEGKPFMEKETQYDFVDVDSNESVSTDLLDSEDHWESRIFPQAVKTIQRFFEGQDTAQKTTELELVYGAYGNVSTIKDYGATDDEADNLEASIQYHPEMSGNHVLSMPSSIIVKDGQGNTLRIREADIYPTGQVKEIRQYVSLDKEAETASVHNFLYDDYGNLLKVTRPANKEGKRLEVEYTYDNTVNTYVEKVWNSYAYYSTAKYDFKFGQLLESTSLNGQKISYELDAVGRVHRIKGPYEQQGGAPFTIEFTYVPDAPVPYALTKHYDPAHPNNTMDTYTFVDGLGRVLQTKKDAAIYQGEGKADKEQVIVSGRVIFDGLGRAEKAYYPTLEEKNPATNQEFTADFDEVEPTETIYDELNRARKVILPDGAITETAYGFGNDREGKLQFSTTTTDAEGQVTVQYTDARGRVTAVKNAGDIWTSFSYSALGEQLTATDDQGHTTVSEYDLLGRRIKRTHPDAGLTEYFYDPVGNITELITANLRESGAGAVQYQYEYERLTDILYPQNEENNVHYTYGAMGAQHNRAGRIETQEDASGAQEFFYGPLGEVVKNIRTIIVPQFEEQTYVTEWQYDTWNRLTGMTYADGEEVTYAYNVGGLLHSMSGKKKNQEYKYVDQLGYDKFEQRVFLAYGNGTKTEYSYEPERRRLQNMTAYTSQGRAMMDNAYGYDAVNNITSLVNSAPVPNSNLMGGSSEYHYEYDQLYRLTEAEGKYTGANEQHRYSLSMAYNTVGGITSKIQTHDKKGGDSDSWVKQNKTTYSLEYAYGEEQPHAPVHIGEKAYSYDGNGNLTGWEHDVSGQRRRIHWDEENRIRAIYDNGAAYHYVYDASGERVLKGRSNGQSVHVNGEWKAGSGNMGNYTVYVNPYLVLKSGGYSKHYYIEGQRIVSKLGSGIDGNGKGPLKAGKDKVNYSLKHDQLVEGIVKNLKFLGLDGQILTAGKSGKVPPGQINGTGKGGKTDETFQYFYHPDHLGSSSYITDATGEVYQHLEYFAFGETFIEEHSNTHRTPYLFNGKELDEETGLYYYGARYYDPVTSVWTAVDPAAMKMPAWSPYNYTFNNPVKLSDPDGRLPILPLLIKAGAGGAADMMAQAAMNYYFNPETAGNVEASFGEINWWQVGRSSAEGLIPWKTPGGRLGRAAATAIGDVTVNAISEGANYSKEQALQDFAVGFIGDLAGGGVGELISKYGSTAVARGLSRMGFDDKQIESILTGNGTTWNGPVDYSSVPDSRTTGPGRRFTQAQKRNLRQANMDANNGYLRSDQDGSFLDMPARGSGNMNQAEIDHIVPRSQGGANSSNNAQVLSKRQNLIKSDN